VYDWADYLNVADALLAQVGGEGAERSAISRAYYACYGKAWRYAHSKQVPLTGTGSDHRTVWDWFLEDPNAGPVVVRTRVSEYGKRLKQWRIIADYQDSKSGLPKITSNALDIARTLLADLATLP
jgi:hypothetical protein